MYFWQSNSYPQRHIKDPLVQDITEYMNSIDGGNYRPETENRQVDLKASKRFILSLLEQGGIANTDLSALSNPPTIPQLGHLLACLALMDNLKNQQLPSVDEFQKLKGALSQVQAGMPGPCFLYFLSIQNESFSPQKKIVLMNEILSHLFTNIDKFGLLGKTAFHLIVTEWITLIDDAKLSHEPSRLNRYKEYLKELPALPELTHELEPLDKLITESFLAKYPEFNQQCGFNSRIE